VSRALKVCVVAMGNACAVAGDICGSKPQVSSISAADVYAVALKDLEGSPFPLTDLKGKVVLITNIATK